jgi:hypothetical protein
MNFKNGLSLCLINTLAKVRFFAWGFLKTNFNEKRNPLYTPWRHVVIAWCTKWLPSNETAVNVDRVFQYKHRLCSHSNTTETQEWRPLSETVCYGPQGTRYKRFVYLAVRIFNS